MWPCVHLYVLVKILTRFSEYGNERAEGGELLMKVVMEPVGTIKHIFFYMG